MPPTSIVTHRQRARVRLAENVRQAALHGTPNDACQIEVIVTACVAGTLSIAEAHDRVLALRAEQRTRQQAA